MVQAISQEISGLEIVPSPALHMLAALPFRIVITTNYDHLFDIALTRANTRDGQPKQPIVRIYDPTRTGPPEAVPLDPSEERPILLKLHGDIDKPESIVVTEDDYILFAQSMSTRYQFPIPENIRARMCTWPILLIGYNLRDYNLRLLFRMLYTNLDVANIPLSHVVDPSPENPIDQVWQHGAKPMVRFIPENLWDFVPSLYEEIKGVEYEA